jgi:hypothetical protein
MYQNSTASTPLVLCLLFFVFIFCGCGKSSASKQQERLLAQLDSNQVVMTEFTRRQTDQLLKATEERLNEPVSSEKAKIWQLKMMQIKEYTKTITTYLQNLYKQLGTATVYEVFVKGIKGKDLYHQLFEYKKNILKTDESLYEEFFRTIGPKTDTADNTAISQDYIRQYLTGLTNAQAGVFLRKLEQQLALNENRLITYCFYQTSANICGIFKSSAMVSQSSSVVQKGEYLSIMAGIGSYSARANPKIIINGKQINMGNDPVAYYKMKINHGKGKYSIPVQIDYLDEDGIATSREVIVEYSVR